jgi:peptidoglycan/LPS O-acetylase OafA/YrhL
MRKYIGQLDGLRAVAVVFVLIGHSGPNFAHFPAARHYIAQYGATGVQMFFVLSGFLITGILLAEKDSPHYFRNFYARRGLRIWPLYYLVVIFTLASGAFGRHGVSWWPYLFYVSNLTYGVDHAQPVPFGPIWSLAVEEQFYLAWPALVWMLTRKRLMAFCAVLMVVCPIPSSLGRRLRPQHSPTS